VSERVTAARHRKARHEYEILETHEAGMVLLGTEVKSLREGKASIAEAYASFRGEELYLREMTIPEYSHSGYARHDPKRARKLLLHRRELRKLKEALATEGLTLVPLEVYFKEGYAKVQLALARGRKLHDKRQALRRAEATREMRRAVGRRE